MRNICGTQRHTLQLCIWSILLLLCLALAKQQRTYYQILEVSPDSSIEEVKKSYRKLAKLYHPDKNKGDGDAEAKFIEVSAAYEILSDEVKRKEYDLSLRTGRGSNRFTEYRGAQQGGWTVPNFGHLFRTKGSSTTRSYSQQQYQNHAEMQEILRRFREQFEHFEQSGGFYYRSSDGRIFYSPASSSRRSDFGGRGNKNSGNRSWQDYLQDFYHFMIGDYRQQHSRYQQQQQYQEQHSPLFIRTLYSLVWFTFLFMFVIPILF